jgi:hypothetical protein
MDVEGRNVRIESTYSPTYVSRRYLTGIGWAHGEHDSASNATDGPTDDEHCIVLGRSLQGDAHHRYGASDADGP